MFFAIYCRNCFNWVLIDFASFVYFNVETKNKKQKRYNRKNNMNWLYIFL